MTTLEFSRPFPVSSLRDGSQQNLLAREPELRALAARFGIPAVEKLEAALIVRASLAMPGQYEVEGEARAGLVLTCGISGEDYRQDVQAPIRAIFVSGPVPAHTEDMDINYEWDDPEPLENGIIDLSELVAQHIVLAIPAFPRKPDASWTGPTDEDPERAPTAKPSPFAILQGLKEHKT